MKASELRLGNLVYSSKELRGKKLTIRIPLRISKISSYECEVQLCENTDEKIKSYRVINSYIDPIPLDEQWLFSLGFLKNGPNFIKDNIGISLSNLPLTDNIKNHSFYRVLIIDDVDGRSVVPIFRDAEFKYVHQLQNIYFALNGKELNVF